MAEKIVAETVIGLGLVASAGLLAVLCGAISGRRRRRRNPEQYGVEDSYEDVVRRAFETGNIVIGNRRPDGKFDVEEIPDQE